MNHDVRMGARGSIYEQYNTDQGLTDIELAEKPLLEMKDHRGHTDVEMQKNDLSISERIAQGVLGSICFAATLLVSPLSLSLFGIGKGIKALKGESIGSVIETLGKIPLVLTIACFNNAFAREIPKKMPIPEKMIQEDIPHPVIPTRAGHAIDAIEDDKDLEDLSLPSTTTHIDDVLEKDKEFEELQHLLDEEILRRGKSSSL